MVTRPCGRAVRLAMGVLAVVAWAGAAAATESRALRGPSSGGASSWPTPSATQGRGRAAQASTSMCLPAWTTQSISIDLPNLDGHCQDQFGCAQGTCSNGVCAQVEAPSCPCAVDQMNIACTNSSTAYRSYVSGQCTKDADCKSKDGKTWGKCCQGSDKNAKVDCPFPGICLGTPVPASCSNRTGGAVCGLNSYCNGGAGKCHAILAPGATCVVTNTKFYMANYWASVDSWAPFRAVFDLPQGEPVEIGECGLFAGCLNGKCTPLFSLADAGVKVGVPPANEPETAAQLQMYCALGLVLDPTAGTCVERTVTNNNCAMGSPGILGLCPSLQQCVCTDAGGVGATKACGYSVSEYRYWGTRGSVAYAVKQVPKITAAIMGLYQCAQANCNGLQPKSMGLQNCLVVNCASQYATIPCSLFVKTPAANLIAPLGICCRALVFDLDWASVSASAGIPFGSPAPCCDGYCPGVVLNCPVSVTVYVLFGVGCAFIVGCCWFWCYCCWCRRKDWYKDNCKFDKVLHCRCCGCCCRSCMDDAQKKKMTQQVMAAEEAQQEKERARAAARGENYYKKNPLQATAAAPKGAAKKKGSAPNGAEPAADMAAAVELAPMKKKEGAKKKKKKSAEQGPLVGDDASMAGAS